jgi:lauroyl/myristoyl acyltransferase
LIRKHPEQYFWLHDRYRGAPDASPFDPSSGTV